MTNHEMEALNRMARAVPIWTSFAKELDALERLLQHLGGNSYNYSPPNTCSCTDCIREALSILRDYSSVKVSQND